MLQKESRLMVFKHGIKYGFFTALLCTVLTLNLIGCASLEINRNIATIAEFEPDDEDATYIVLSQEDEADLGKGVTDTGDVTDVPDEVYVEMTVTDPVGGDEGGSGQQGGSGGSGSMQYGELNINYDYRSEFDHGYKGAEYQKYIVLHDTEGSGSPQSVIDYWDGNNSGVAAHFIVGMDGSVYQCVPMDRIAHHSGYGPTGYNSSYGVPDESRDDKTGTAKAGSYNTDYGMNSYSIGIEMVHYNGQGYYPTAQLEALDALIAYIDDYYGFASTIIDHKTWVPGNSDTSSEFAGYLSNYQNYRSYKA